MTPAARVKQWNAFYDKYRGLILIIGPGVALVTALLALMAVLGFGQLPTPGSQIAHAQTTANLAILRVDTLSAVLSTHLDDFEEVSSNIDRTLQSLKVDLCLRNTSSDVRARMQIDCETILRGRP